MQDGNPFSMERSRLRINPGGKLKRAEMRKEQPLGKTKSRLRVGQFLSAFFVQRSKIRNPDQGLEDMAEHWMKRRFLPKPLQLLACPRGRTRKPAGPVSAQKGGREEIPVFW